MYCYHCMTQLPDGSDFCSACGRPTAYQAPPHHLTPGTLLHGKYLVGSALGEGGFGITYIGIDTTLELKVAVKEYFPNGYANRNHTDSNRITLNRTEESGFVEKGKERFLSEARSLARFSGDSGIVNVREFFEENNTAYIIMELVDGMNLSEYLRRSGSFAPERITELMIPVMRSLSKIHAAGIIHRDISPDNIMYMDEGRLVLTDFGSARYYTGSASKTMSVMLKRGYAPYEQYSAKGNQGPWTDVYGICATLYRCITGVTPPDALDRLMNDTLTPPSAMGIAVPKRIENAIMSGMALHPTNRCQSMNELIGLLQGTTEPVRLLNNERTVYADDELRTAPADRSYGDRQQYRQQQESEPVRKKSSGAPIAAAIIAAVLILGGLIAFLLLRPDNKSDKTAETTASQPAETALPSDSGTIELPDVTGKKLSDATAQLESLGLRVETEFENSDSVAADYVIRQSAGEGRKLNRGDSVMLTVSLGKPTEAPTDAPEPEQPTSPYDVEAEVEKIRTMYYETQQSPGTPTAFDGVTYYRNDAGALTKIECDAGYDGWSYARNYFYHDNELYFAFIFDGTEEHRLYFVDGTLIRYIDDHGSVFDYGSINCPYEKRAADEAKKLAQ